MAQKNRSVRWVGWDNQGLEHMPLSRSLDGWNVQSVVIGNRGGTAYGLSYTLALTRYWAVRTLKISMTDGPEVAMSSDGAGHWKETDGTPIPQLDGCIDIDIAATPFTNTLPIRRLQLELGASADINVAYFPMPDLAFSSVEQRYTRQRANTYLYEGMFRSFSAALETDADGLILDYPETFRRLE